MTDVLSTLKVMPETKTEVELFGKSLINSIQWGEINPLELDGRLKALEELIDMVRKSPEMTEGLITEALKYNSKSFSDGKYSYQIKEVGVKYDFSCCDDDKLIDLRIRLERLSNEIKSREMFLKSIQPGMPCFDKNGIQLFPPAKTSTTRVITILK